MKPMKKLSPDEVQTKLCTVCGATYSRRKRSGGLDTPGRWARRIVCSAKCRNQRAIERRRVSADVYFAKRVQEGRPDACWPWVGPKHKRSGYGYLYHEHAYQVAAHRYAFEQGIGPIPSGMIVRHRCDNPPCCNPAHLEIGTHQDNANDKVARGRHVKVRRDFTTKTKVKSHQLAALKRDFLGLPRTPTGKIAFGYAKRLAAQYNITPAHLTVLGRTL